MSGSKLLDGITLYVQLVRFKTFGWNLLVTKSFEPDMKYWQVEHKGWFHPNVLNQTWSTDRLNMQGDSIQKFLSDSKLLDWIFLNVQFVSTSCLVQNFWMESPCMFNLSVLHVWFKTFGWNHPLCSTCLFFMSDSEHTGWFHPSFEPDMKKTSWIYRVIPSKLNVLVLNIAEKLLAGC
jgi:hypothetical protein